MTKTDQIGDPDEIFLVFGIRGEHDDEGTSVGMEILGAFDNLEAAVIWQEVHANLDTCIEATSISSTKVSSEIPDVNIYLLVTAEDDEIYVRSRCVPLGTEPLLIEESDRFECLCYPSDKDAVIDRAVAWLSRKGVTPQVVEQISPEAEQYL